MWHSRTCHAALLRRSSGHRLCVRQALQLVVTVLPRWPLTWNVAHGPLSAEASDMSGVAPHGPPGGSLLSPPARPDAMWTAIGLAIGTYLNWKFVAKRLRRSTPRGRQRHHGARLYRQPLPRHEAHPADHRHRSSSFCSSPSTPPPASSPWASCSRRCSAGTSRRHDGHRTIIVFLYTFMGGYHLSVCTTDLVQGHAHVSGPQQPRCSSAASRRPAALNLGDLPAEHPGFLSGTEIATPLLDEAGNQLVGGNEPMFGPKPAPTTSSPSASGLACGSRLLRHAQVLIRFMSIRHSDEIREVSDHRHDLACGFLSSAIASVLSAARSFPPNSSLIDRRSVFIVL